VGGSRVIVLLVALAFVAAGCGGGDDGESTGAAQSTTTTTNTTTTAPEGSTTGQEILANAGLKACTQSQSTGAGFIGSGLVQSITSVVQPSCETKPKVPTTMTALTYNSQETAANSATAAEKAQPNAVVIQPTVAPYTTTVLVISGPKAQEYGAAIEGALPQGS
jgi:hypothetical protein